MKKIITLILCLGFSINYLSSQIVIDDNDMPDVGDTIRLSQAFTAGGIDYTLTGNNYTWDFSGLNIITQRVDTFVSVLSTPLIYQIVFLYPFVSTIASPQQDFDLIPNLQVNDVYRFYKESSSSFADVGFGAYINEIPIPIKYDEPDVLYKFPVTVGAVDSSSSGFSFDIPGLGFFLNSKKRINTVDGWGTLTTPYGTFETIRIKSDIIQYDSIYIDSIGVGIPVNRTITEYKWLGNNFGIPLLYISKEGLALTVNYIDSVRSNFIEVPEYYELKNSFNIYPNPASTELTIIYELSEPSSVELTIFSSSGKKLLNLANSSQNAGTHRKKLNIEDLGLPSGVYLVNLNINNNNIVKRFVKY